VQIVIPIKDTIRFHNLYINLRNTKDYPYSNLFLIAQMSFPDNTIVVDTLEYEMTDPTGKFLGSGFSDLKENKLFYKEKVRFRQQGMYHFEVRQAMRERNKVVGISQLKGVSDVGISVELIE
jgi:gliding motility-associated lipoprotein GldH